MTSFSPRHLSAARGRQEGAGLSFPACQCIIFLVEPKVSNTEQISRAVASAVSPHNNNNKYSFIIAVILSTRGVITEEGKSPSCIGTPRLPKVWWPGTTILVMFQATGRLTLEDAWEGGWSPRLPLSSVPLGRLVHPNFLFLDIWIRFMSQYTLHGLLHGCPLAENLLHSPS